MVTKKEAETRLMELKEVEFYTPTAAELHRPVGHLVGRVKRQEERRHKQKIEAQKMKVKKYLADLEAYEAGLNSIEPTITLKPFPKKIKTRREKQPKRKFKR